jgi:hypothetical protein
MTRLTPVTVLLFLLAAWPGRGEPVLGWRGNWTGLWPDAHPPLEWYRLPKGVMTDLRTRAGKPAEGAENEAARIENGLVRQWLVLGPFPVADSIKDFDKPQISDEAAVEPSAGDKVGDLAWKPLAVRGDDPMSFGEVHLGWADLAAAFGGYKPNRVGYAHTYLYTPRGGTVRAVVDHAHGLAAWLNGKLVYRNSERGEVLGNYVNLSRFEFQLSHAASPRFDLDLKAGWNRLLFKVSAYNRPGWDEMHFALRLHDLQNIPYESKNILWMTELPHRSNATPIIVGDRLFVMAEPDELLCLDKKTGHILWSAANNYYEALPPAERRANPAFKDKIDPLTTQLKAEKDFVRRIGLRAKIHKELTAIDAARFGWSADGHFEAHFGIVGFTTPTPVSDGKHVWVWCGNGVAACYDLDGRRRWIRRIEAGQLSYACSPALIDGTLAVFLNKLFGLDAETGEVRWQQPRINRNTGAVVPARLAGVGVFVTQHGHIVRAADGHVLFRDRQPGGDAGWCPPVILGDTVYLPRYGVSQLSIGDFTGLGGDEWKPKYQTIELPEEIHRKPDGSWIDRMTAGSPLVHDGIAYEADIWASFYAIDLRAKRMLYRQETALRGLFHYNAVPVAASPTLVGENILIQDNQGTALVLQPGRTFKEVRRNRIATQLERFWPIPAQETLSYAPPVADGNRLYLRGERYLYCIGGE